MSKENLASNPADGYFEVPTSVFVAKIDVKMAALPPIAFFMLENGKMVKFRAADQPYSALALRVHETIWIRDEDAAVISRQAELLVNDPKLTSSLPIARRVEILKRSAMVVADQVFTHPTPTNVSKSVKMVGGVVQLLMKEPQAFQMMNMLSSHDPYTLKHSMGTAVLCIILARKIGITQEKELNAVAMAGLLHDIGKTKIRKEVVNKSGALTDSERRELRGHVEAGYEIVKDQPDLSEQTKRAVLEHHEAKDGSGYPEGLRAESIHLYSKIVTLCDIFSSLTTERAHSRAMNPFDALKKMRAECMHKVDDELFKQLVMIYGGKL